MMTTPTDAIVKQIQGKISEWDKAFERFQDKQYPVRLLAQVQYRRQVKALLSVRLLVEERLMNFSRR
ncbi:MAG TPA: hypothetical protein VN963_07950 [bacterium]|nr:hypothetical protein [bacterium]